MTAIGPPARTETRRHRPMKVPKPSTHCFLRKTWALVGLAGRYPPMAVGYVDMARTSIRIYGHCRHLQVLMATSLIATLVPCFSSVQPDEAEGRERLSCPPSPSQRAARRRVIPRGRCGRRRGRRQPARGPTGCRRSRGCRRRERGLRRRRVPVGAEKPSIQLRRRFDTRGRRRPGGQFFAAGRGRHRR
jgi:hypothetical protein